MVSSIEKFLKAYQFRFETESLGELICNNFSTPVMKDAKKWLSDKDNKDSVAFTRHLTTLLCQPVDTEKDKDYRINKAQSELLTSTELVEFSRLFLEKNSYLLEDRDKQEAIRNVDDEGNVSISFKSHPSDELSKKSDESETDHLLRVVDSYITQSVERSKKLIESATKSAFSKTTLDLLKENQRISDSLGSSLTLHQRPLELTELPENPVFETNRQLASFGKELNEVAQLIKNMNDLGVEMAVDSAAATARTKFWNNLMFFLGLITLAVTAIFSYLSYSSSNDSSSKIESILIEQNALLITQEENQKELIKAISSISPVIEKYVAQSQENDKALYLISEQLNEIKMQNKSQSSAAKVMHSSP
ncbi:hypothetical protein NOK74_05110 [Vibrio parahaemolyticus]|uniref:hypothetical protein n=1 Tax=Vibrio parahaemolyticus TaxID=670 RepID=UPI002269CBFF|nr:hypothetical protein [Vibrio parahaemolyticus]MCX8871558.1 hypothetical protein [Vibrio parahaemolyticus]